MHLVIKTLLYLITISGSIISWKLFSGSKNSRFIAFYSLVISLIAFNQILSFYNSAIVVFPIFNSFTGYFLIPLMFFHIISLFKIKNLKKIVLKHFKVNIPFLCIIIFWIFDDYGRKLLRFNSNSYITILITVQCSFYIILLIIFLRKRRKLIQEIKTTLQFKRIRFAITLFLIQSIITVLLLIENFMRFNNLDEILVLSIFFLLTTQISLIALFQRKYPIFFKENDRLFIISKKLNNNIEILKSDSELNVLKELQKLMSDQKIFKNSKLTLKSLAKELNIAEHNLSKILMDSYNLTYTQYISFQRLEEAKKLLRQSVNGDTRVNEVMYEVGFNSKSAFNTWFKKYTGFTPTEFKKGSE
ncbi:helix-turn-helix domain-containing protein [Muriicola sp. Z0-33]|uniref:helix-turn-helix domain-containing protein n=1 Tax=Muriicola sp. Z0-33 TaxID=2816957 RepID=UPI0022373C22|nr:AraC family transcriptional regulator [Muriicola sp. Z0-33]MCW5518110.1 helix-turn-helix transcriptional regulator [Muriicola sp. Z0-33]